MEIEREDGRREGEPLWTSYDVLLPQIQALQLKSKVSSNFRAKPPPMSLREEDPWRRRRGGAVYLYRLYRGGQDKAPASVNQLFTAAGSLNSPPR